MRVSDADESDVYTPYDCAGMILLNCATPLAIYAIFFPATIMSLITWAGLAGGLALLTYLLVLLTRWRWLGWGINLMGNILTPIYIIAAIYFWSNVDLLDEDKKPSLPTWEAR